MTDFSSLLQQGAANTWLFIPSAILLGALHGLEPGHSKTMMAAFIVAIRGTVSQALLLGLSATLSHTLVVWVVALMGLYFGRHWNAATSEPYFQLASAGLIVVVALWMLWRQYRQQHGYDDHHNHDHGIPIDTGHGKVYLSLHEDHHGATFRVFNYEQVCSAAQMQVQVKRSSSAEEELFSFVAHNGYAESVQQVAEPHEFQAKLVLSHGSHQHSYAVEFKEHAHEHNAAQWQELAGEYDDAHARAHAEDIRQRFASTQVTTGQIVMFGLTGGLIPCPASITVLLLCLQLKQFALGATLVLCFSVGLALTMTLSGVLAALSLKHVAHRWKGFGGMAAKAPYLSVGLMLLVGAYMAYEGATALL